MTKQLLALFLIGFVYISSAQEMKECVNAVIQYKTGKLSKQDCYNCCYKVYLESCISNSNSQKCCEHFAKWMTEGMIDYNKQTFENSPYRTKYIECLQIEESSKQIQNNNSNPKQQFNNTETNYPNNRFNNNSLVDNRYNPDRFSNNRLEKEYEEKTGQVIFLCCDNEYTLNYTIIFTRQVDFNLSTSPLDNTYIIFSVNDLDSITMQEIKIQYRLSLNLGVQSNIKSIVIEEDDLNKTISLGSSRFRDFSIEKVEGKCNPHYPGKQMKKTVMNADNGLEITYVITYTKRTGGETISSDYYNIQGYLKNHYNKTIEYTYVAGTISIGMDLLNIKATNLLPGHSVNFKIENAKVFADCNFAKPEVHMPIVVLRK
jgi:hypothetical protein